MVYGDLRSSSLLLPCFRHLEMQLHDYSNNPNRCSLNLNSQHLPTLFQADLYTLASRTTEPDLFFPDICLLVRPLVKVGQLLTLRAVLK